MLEKTCPSCGARRIGSFRWCRECGFDFDAARSASEPSAVFRIPDVIPDVIPPAAAAAPPDRAAAGPRPRRRVPMVVAAALIVLVATATLAVILLQQRPTGTATSSGAALGASGAAPTRAVAPTPFVPITLSGEGPATAEFSIPEGSSGVATIVNNGEGPFSVWSLGADGAKQDLLVNVVGSFAGTRLFDAVEHSVAFAVESDGTWSIEVKPISAARKWNLAERLVGDGPDVVLVLPPTSADTNSLVVHDGASNFVVSAFTGSGKRELVNEVGPFRGDVVLPQGTSLIEVEADAAWSIAPN